MSSLANRYINSLKYWDNPLPARKLAGRLYENLKKDPNIGETSTRYHLTNDMIWYVQYFINMDDFENDSITNFKKTIGRTNFHLPYSEKRCILRHFNNYFADINLLM